MSYANQYCPHCKGDISMQVKGIFVSNCPLCNKKMIRQRLVWIKPGTALIRLLIAVLVIGIAIIYEKSRR